jgi:hypothetical protein
VAERQAKREAGERGNDDVPARVITAKSVRTEMHTELRVPSAQARALLDRLLYQQRFVTLLGLWTQLYRLCRSRERR